MSTPQAVMEEPVSVRKPDPDEPWRYVCPDCQSQVTGSRKHWNYRCHGCDEYYAADELLDQKTGRIGVLHS